jgi:urocanate reductase
MWNTKPTNVDPLYFASGATLKELAANINNPYQKRPMPGTVLQETVERYNSFVTSGADTDFKKPKPMYKIEKPPFHAAWATPILHDSLTGLRVNTDQQVIDIHGQVIPGLYCGGESMGGLAQHGLGRDLVSGRIAGLHAGRSTRSTN